jgi:chain length determinant protein tyrosine kinase EpsG
MDNLNPLHASRSIGAILIDAGKLSAVDVERIMQAQREQGLRFGEAAVQMGLLTLQDIQFALARQYDYPCLAIGQDDVSAELVAAYQPFSAQVEALRALRSQLMVRWFTGEPGRRILAVASPGRGEGRSYLAANLAVVFSQLGEHTLLIDADMRNPRQHELFKLENRTGLSAILSSRGDAGDVRRIPSFMDLSVLTAGPTPPNPQELLGRPLFANLLKDMANEYDVIIIDTPAAVDYADVQTVARRAGGALLMARAKETRTAELRDLATTLTGSGVVVVGSVFNESVIGAAPN